MTLFLSNDKTCRTSKLIALKEQALHKGIICKGPRQWYSFFMSSLCTTPVDYASQVQTFSLTADGGSRINCEVNRTILSAAKLIIQIKCIMNQSILQFKCFPWQRNRIFFKSVNWSQPTRACFRIMKCKKSIFIQELKIRSKWAKNKNRTKQTQKIMMLIKVIIVN